MRSCGHSTAVVAHRPAGVSSPDAGNYATRAVLLAAALVALAAGCSDSTGPAPVAQLHVEPASAERVTGYPVQLRATTLDAAGNVLKDRPVTWTSSNPTIATVDNRGNVATRTPGVAVISAASEGQVGYSTVTVLVVPVASVRVSPSTAELLPGDTLRLVAVPLDSIGGILTGRTVAWHSSNAPVAAVGATGLVTAVAPGSADISATIEGRTGTSTIQVLVPPDPCQFEGARAIALGSATTGTLAHTDCPLGDGSYYDLYRFELTTPTTVRIDLVSTAFDAYLWLMSETAVLAVDDDSGGAGNSRILMSLAAGTYYIAANSYSGHATGSYVLTLAAVTAADLGSLEAGTASAGTAPEKRKAADLRFPRIR